MIGIYLLVTIFSQFSPHSLYASLMGGPAAVNIDFEKIGSVRVGSPVLVRGELAGTVTSISDSSVGRSNHNISISVDIVPTHRTQLREGTVALITSPASKKSADPSITAVELLVPSKDKESTLLDSGATIKGFASFEEFWSS